MISRRDLEIAVDELLNAQPTYQTCAKLADLYTILDHLKAPYQEDSGPGSEFMKAVHGKDVGAVFKVMDELMDATQILNPRLYENVIIRINEL